MTDQRADTPLPTDLLCPDCGHHLHRPNPGQCQWHDCRCAAEPAAAEPHSSGAFWYKGERLAAEPPRRFDTTNRCGWCGSKGEHLPDCDNPNLHAAQPPRGSQPDPQASCYARLGSPEDSE